MVKKYVNKKFGYFDTGTIDWIPIIKNFSNIEEVVNDHAKDIKHLYQRQTSSVVYAINKEGRHTIVEARKHLRFRIKNAFVFPGDDSGRENKVSIDGYTDEITLKDSFNAAKVKIFDIENQKVLYFKDIVVVTSSERPIIVGLTYESYEEEGDS